MNKPILVLLVTWSALTAAVALAAARPVHRGVPGTEHALHAIDAQVATWTCAHNAYRSVACT